jgi:hypothetical protein
VACRLQDGEHAAGSATGGASKQLSHLACKPTAHSALQPKLHAPQKQALPLLPVTARPHTSYIVAKLHNSLPLLCVILCVAGLTLQSGLVVDISKLQQQYQGQCCLPRSAVNDFTPIMRIDNSNGNYFVSNDPNCNTPLDSRSFPAAFDFIHVCDQCPPGGCFDGAAAGAGSQTTIIINGGDTFWLASITYISKQMLPAGV